MQNLLKIFLVLVVLGAGIIALAQEATPPEVTEAINLDEDIKPEDLGVGEPRLLPDSPFYFIKNWARGIQEILTFNPVAKAELESKFTNEKLMELKKMIEEKKSAKAIEKAAENYQKGAEEIEGKVEKIKEKAKDNPRIESFLDKYTKHQILHQRILQRLENQVPAEVLEKITEARERHLERFSEVMTKLEDRKEKIRERLEAKMEEIQGSEFKNFKNLEVLKELEEKVPEEAKEAIQKAEENILKRLQGDLEKMSPEDQERFKEYIDKISGEKERQLEIMEKIKSESPELKENLEKVKERIKEKIKEKKGEPVACAQVITYCIDPSTGECAVYPDACSTPKPCQSCSVDEAGASSSLFANARVIEMSPGTGCKNLWWFDNEHKYCQQKEFCGVYMYLGLRTFGTKEECESAL